MLPRQQDATPRAGSPVPEETGRKSSRLETSTNAFCGYANASDAAAHTGSTFQETVAFITASPQSSCPCSNHKPHSSGRNANAVRQLRHRTGRAGSGCAPGPSGRARGHTAHREEKHGEAQLPLPPQAAAESRQPFPSSPRPSDKAGWRAAPGPPCLAPP